MNISIPPPSTLLDPCNADPDAMLDAIVTVIAAEFCIVAGINFLRHTFNKNINPCMTWIFGLIWICIGVSLLFVANIYAPELYTAPLQPVAILMNFAVSRQVNREIINTDGFMYSVYIWMGCFLAAAAASLCPSNNHNEVDQGGTIAWAVINGSGICVGLIALMNAHFKRIKPEKYQAAGYTTVAAMLLGNASVTVRAIVLHQQAMMLVLPVLMCALLGLLVLTRALYFFKALTIIPILSAVMMLTEIVGGAVFFNEFRNFSAGRVVVFAMAVVLILVAAAMQLRGEKYVLVGQGDEGGDQSDEEQMMERNGEH